MSKHAGAPWYFVPLFLVFIGGFLWALFSTFSSDDHDSRDSVRLPAGERPALSDSDHADYLNQLDEQRDPEDDYFEW